MSLCELDIGWAANDDERRYLQWELLSCDDILGVFLTARDDVLAVLFAGDRRRFRAWARTLTAEAAA